MQLKHEERSELVQWAWGQAAMMCDRVAANAERDAYDAEAAKREHDAAKLHAAAEGAKMCAAKVRNLSVDDLP
jgi:hypothetical protein